MLFADEDRNGNTAGRPIITNAQLALSHSQGVDYFYIEDSYRNPSGNLYVRYDGTYLGGYHNDNGLSTWSFSTSAPYTGRVFVEGGTQGIQGVQGIGFQGTQGKQGNSIQGQAGSAQGTAGQSGAQGSLGRQGAQSAQGQAGSAQGTSGAQGQAGFQGTKGGLGSIGEPFDYNNSSSYSAPITGHFHFSGSSVPTTGGLIYMYFDDQDANGNAVSNPTIADSQIVLSHDLGQDKFFIQSSNVYSTYARYAARYIGGYHMDRGLSTWAFNDPVGRVYIDGTQGIQGAQGTQGVGAQGTQATQGQAGSAQGTAGQSGSQGTLGRQGAQATQGQAGSAQGSAGFGSQGTQGSQSAQGQAGSAQGSQGEGAQGARGIQGDRGIYGESYYTWSTDTSQGNGVVSGAIEFSKTSVDFYTLYISRSLTDSDGATSAYNSLAYGFGTLKIISTLGTDTFKLSSTTSTGSGSSAGVKYTCVYVGGYHDDAGLSSWSYPSGSILGILIAQTVQGLQGNRGFQGVQGQQGTAVQGIRGSHDAQGVQGAQATQGVQGLTGAGFQGTQGPSGPGNYTNSDVDTHLNTASASTDEVLSWNGTDYAWVTNAGGGGGGGTDPDEDLVDLEVTTGTTKVIAGCMTGIYRYNYGAYWTNIPLAPRTSYSYSTNQYWFPSGTSGSTTYNSSFALRTAIGYGALISTGYAEGQAYTASREAESRGRTRHNRTIIFSDSNGLGHANAEISYIRNANYLPVTVMVMPIRNNSTGAINVTVYTKRQSYGGYYNGSNIFTATPNNSSGTAYSTVNSVSYSVLNSYTSYTVSQNSSYGSDHTISIPAGKTVIVGIVETAYYITTNYIERYSAFYRLSDTFSNANIQCDLRMIRTMQYADYYNMGWTNNGWTSSDEYKLWNFCGTLYGDR